MALGFGGVGMGVVASIYWLEARIAAKLRAVHRLPTTAIYSAPNTSSAEVEKPYPKSESWLDNNLKSYHSLSQDSHESQFGPYV